MSTPCSGNEPATPTNTSPNNETSNSCLSMGVGVASNETNSSRELKIFKKVIRDPVLRAPFQEFLEQQFCAENLNFYLAVEQFKEIQDFQERSSFGRRIFDRYFAMNSTEPVNIDNSTSKRIRETVESGGFPLDTYDVAQYQILHLLKYDCWPRFLRSTNNSQPSFTDEELAADDEDKNGHSQPTSLNNTNEFEAAAQQSQPAPNAPAATKEKPSKQYSMPAEMTSPVKKNSLSPTHLRRCRPVEPKHCQLMIGDQFNTETVTLSDPTMSVRRWTQEMADAQGMDRMHVEVVDAETGSTIDPARQAIDALQSRALRLVPVVSFIIEFLPANFSFKNPASTPTKLVCIRARHSLSTGAVLRPLLHKYTLDPQVTRIVLNGSLEQVKRSCAVGQVSQKCLTVMSEAQYSDRVNAGKVSLPPRDPILSQLPSTIYEQNNFPFHQNGDISYCEIPNESERNKHAHLQHDGPNAAHQQKEYTLSIFNKFVRKASHAVSKSDPNPSAGTSQDRMASGVYSPATGGPSFASRAAAGTNFGGSANQVNAGSASTSSNNKTEKKVVKPESEKEKLKPRSDDIPTTSTSTPMAVETKPNGSRTTEEPLKRMGKSGDDGSQEPQGIRHPAIFSTKIGDEAAAAAAGASPSTSAPSTSTSVQTKTTTSPTKSPTSTTITTSGTTTSATSSVATAPPPVLHAMRSASTPATSSQLTGGGGGNPRESSWQTAAYV
ncbi:Regulator of G-protein signaling rgs-6 [Caenorhabditis elegans]|uniref:Isoform b of Regulator of G-protein signaling rgs-6 n=1 Tax=Caenorhabditis elegans TaxID=6239 RepID=Q18563-2|nr:Regulator of G-protein signaling rgs-6 [Caenorhabditis elegans]CDX47459.1 Regulator of G-protein signaling rgs-6 [Caenorhabditis elegans]|eukprot:NP_001294821.1 Regulator of G-protein signaling rgs-6 [Caenorhabditis elegans]